MWTVDYGYIIPWLDELDDKTVACIFAALEVLEAQGPSLGRPLVDTVKGASIQNMKELRPASIGSSEVRILFAFDPERRAIMLLGGDKSKGKNGKVRWSGWYRKAIRDAEAVWANHLKERRNE